MRGARPGKPVRADSGGEPPHSTGCEADGQRRAKDLRRARPIPQARLTVDLGAPPAVPLRGKTGGDVRRARLIPQARLISRAQLISRAPLTVASGAVCAWPREPSPASTWGPSDP